MKTTKQKIEYLKKTLKNILDNWNNPPEKPYQELTQILNTEYNTICELKNNIQKTIDKYRHQEYTPTTQTTQLTTATYYFNNEKQILYISDNPSKHNIRIYKGTGSYMVNNNTPDTQLDQYMTTRKNYNSDVYDVNVNYNRFPSNLQKPSDNDVQMIFARNMPLTKKVVIDVSLNYASRNIGAFGDNVKYKVGNTIIGSNMAFSEYCILCESIEITDTGDLNQINSDNDRYWYVLLDSKGDLYILEDTNVNRIEAELKLDMDGNLIMEAIT